MASHQTLHRRSVRRIHSRSLTRWRPRRTRHTRRQPALTAQERRIVVSVVALSGLGGALAGAHPTTNALSDAVFAAGFAALLSAAASVARRWTWIVLAG